MFYFSSGLFQKTICYYKGMTGGSAKNIRKKYYLLQDIVNFSRINLLTLKSFIGGMTMFQRAGKKILFAAAFLVSFFLFGFAAGIPAGAAEKSPAPISAW